MTDEMVERAASMQPRPLTQSEIVSLRQDAISTSAEMKKLMLECQARADKLEAELARVQQSNDDWMYRWLDAEFRAEAMLEALESVNKLIEWERENGTHFALLDHEVEYVSGLWFDAKNAVSRALKTAGKE